MQYKKQALAIIAVVAMGFTAQAITIDFGTQWDASNLPLEVLGHSGGNGFSTETQIADLLNSVAGTTFASGDIFKTDQSIQNVGGQFAVSSGWDYLVVQYDGPNGGSVVIALDGNAALVPYVSYNIWGNKPTKYDVSHFAVAGPKSVPDGGSTVALLGLGLVGMGSLRRKFLSK